MAQLVKQTHAQCIGIRDRNE
uniref:Uncharacterized protein n=1 Tax=Anopheles albimanus TaxID=7167 RepID=A0A182FWF6_ANOAL